MPRTSLGRFVRLLPRGHDCGTMVDVVRDGVVLCGAPAAVVIAFDGRDREFDALDSVCDLCQCAACYRRSRAAGDPRLVDLRKNRPDNA